MKALARAAADRREHLPFRFVRDLAIPRSGLVVLLAAPSVGKSMLALNWAWDLTKEGYSVLYHGHDTPWKDQSQRVVALMYNKLVDEVDPAEAEKVLAEMTIAFRWSRADVTTETFEDLLKAEVEFLGEPPTVTIVDIVQDLIKEDSPEAYSSTFSQLHATAQKFHTCLLALHHTNSNSPQVAPTLNDDRYKAGARRAELMLGLSRPATNFLEIGVLKNRGGRAGYSRQLPFHPERGRVA